MNVPTEAELIELENRVLHVWQQRAAADDSYMYEYRICRTLEAVIQLARAQATPIPPMPATTRADRQHKAKRPAKLKGAKH